MNKNEYDTNEHLKSQKQTKGLVKVYNLWLDEQGQKNLLRKYLLD